MARTLDFNSINRPTLSLVMRDENKTHIKVTTPSESLVRELQDLLPELEPRLREGNAEAIAECYNLAAKLINHNLSFVTVTADELREKYQLGLDYLIMFFAAYIEFIGEITNAKN